MRLLVIQNDPYTPLGIVAERVALRGVATEIVHPHHGGSLPATPDGYDGAVVLGGPMAADDDAHYPAFRPMLDLLSKFQQDEKPLLGICLGSQILARCFGGRVRRFEGGIEFGYVPITLTDAGAEDPLLGDNGRTQRVMQWHEDTFDLPPDAVQLMTGDDCPRQAFRIGRTTYAFQCHFEAHDGIVAQWLDAYGQGLTRHYGDGAESEKARVRRESAEHAAAQRRFAEALSDRWLDLVQERAG